MKVVATASNESEERSKGVITFRDGEQTLAVVVRRHYEADGISFLTPDTFPLQLGYMKHPAGHKIKPHQHKLNARRIDSTSEALFVRAGRVMAQLYNLDGQPGDLVVLEAGDIILLVSGGHGFEFLEEGEMIEVKQGPYMGVDDKAYI